MEPLLLAETFAKHIEKFRTARRSTVNRYLLSVLEACNEVIVSPNPASASSKLAHETLKSFYERASSVIGSELPRDELTRLMNALASARIYAWVRILKECQPSEFLALFSSREDADREIDLEAVRAPGAGIPTSLVFALRHALSDRSEISVTRLRALERLCLRRVADLHELCSTRAPA